MDSGLGRGCDSLGGPDQVICSEQSLRTSRTPADPRLGPVICLPILNVNFFFSLIDCGSGHFEPLSEETGKRDIPAGMSQKL